MSSAGVIDTAEIVHLYAEDVVAYKKATADQTRKVNEWLNEQITMPKAYGDSAVDVIRSLNDAVKLTAPEKIHQGLRDRLKNVAIGMVRSKTTAKDYNAERDLATITTQHHALTQAAA